jgi:tetratricopeptide (TPR) repeat protein
VESSILQTGGSIRASIKLIEAGSEETLWADSYEQPLDNILGLYGKVTRDIAGAIDLELSPQEKEKLTTAPEVDPAAYEAYLKGRFWLGKDKEFDHAAKSLAFFEEAIALDPGFAPAQAGLAQIHCNLFVFTGWTNIENATIAREAAARALELDPGSAVCRAAQAGVYMVVDGDWAAAGREWSKIDPRDREKVGDYPLFLCFSARFDEAVEFSRKLLAKEPMSQDRIKTLGMSLMYARRFDEAMPVYEHLLEYYPDHYWGKYGLSVCLERAGRNEEAREVFPGTPTSSDFLIMGDRTRILGVIGDLLDRVEESGSRKAAFHLSRHYACLGDKEQALFWLKIASEEFPRSLLITNVVAEFDFLRSEPAFQDCLRMAGFTEEMVAASQALTTNTILGDP